MEKYYIDVPYKEKDEAKSLGARWDAENKKWYYLNPEDKKLFSKWGLSKKAAFMSLADLSEEQQELIARAKKGENVLVDACIGSGKTTAIQVLCNEFTDKRILYLTYNALLKIDARAKITQSNVTVTNYHGFAYMCLSKAGIKSGTSDLIQMFNEHTPAIGMYDMVVLDEYQDIEQEIAEMLWYIKKRLPDIQIIAVGDMMQKIYDKTTLNVPDFIQDYLGEYTLLRFTKCFRLNRTFAKRLGDIWNKDIYGVNDKCRVETMEIINVVNFLSKQKPEDILCLGSRTGDMSKTLNILERKFPAKYNKNTVYASIADEDRSISSPTAETAIFTTFDSSKGLERKICVVFDFTDDYWVTRTERPMVKYEIMRNIFCVAASRGKNRIIFVKGKNGDILEDKTLATPVMSEAEFNEPFLISEMFDFKYKEDVEECFRLIKRKKLSSDGREINIDSSDGLIDLSPCIGTFQEAAFFKGYDIDEEINYAQDKHRDRPKMYIPDDASVETKILYLTAYQTCYERYATQVKPPFVIDEQRESIFNRLKTEFSGSEKVQETCYIDFQDNEFNQYTIEGKCDVIKGDRIYELKFVSELSHEHFLQLAVYMTALGCDKGVLWNVRKNEMYEVAIPDRKKFLDTVVRTITKGAVKHCNTAYKYQFVS